MVVYICHPTYQRQMPFFQRKASLCYIARPYLQKLKPKSNSRGLLGESCARSLCKEESTAHTKPIRIKWSVAPAKVSGILWEGKRPKFLSPESEWVELYSLNRRNRVVDLELVLVSSSMTMEQDRKARTLRLTHERSHFSKEEQMSPFITGAPFKAGFLNLWVSTPLWVKHSFHGVA